MAAKMLLPGYGGTPAVWNTSMVFFQAVLLLGYGYAHLSYRKLGPRVQPIVHLVLLGAVALTLPIAFGLPRTGVSPSLSLLAQLAAGVGLPFFVVSAGAPLLQRWFAASGGKDPYFLYAASNAASLLALLAYPIVLEPLLRLGEQSRLWMFGFLALGALYVPCAFLVLKIHRTEAPPEPVPAAENPTAATILRWIALAFVPSSLMLGVTTYLTTNLASAPLLWIIPLSLYLLTFVIAFSSRRKPSAAILGRVVAMLMAPMVLVIVLEATEPILALGGLHLLLFFLGALMCHTRLHETRPDPSHLTAFYFWISVGGVLGGAFNALLAPVVFKSLAEYPIALVALVALIPREKSVDRNWLDFAVPVAIGVLTGGAVFLAESMGMALGPGRTALTLGLPALVCFAFAERPLRYGLALGAVFLAARFSGVGATGELLLTERSFFGVHRVVKTEQGRFRDLLHGNTIHGRQSTDPSQVGEPLTYYHRTGPIGQAFETLQPENRAQKVGLVGMGVGSLASYGREGDHFTFYEIDPEVVYIARDSGLFSYIPSSRAKVDVVLGDARLSLTTAPDGAYDLLVLDAFSSDAIPTHLLTVEALNLYRSKIGEQGVIAFHISNRYLELKPVLAAAAKKLGMAALAQDDGSVTDEQMKETGKFRSTWVLLAPNQKALEVFQRHVEWSPLEAEPGDQAWTDDFSNIVGAFLARMRE